MSEREIIAALAIEFWKLHRAFERISRDVPLERAGKLSAQLRYSNGQLNNLVEQAGLRLVSFDDEQFSAELPVSPINAEDVEGDNGCVVEATVEPAVVADGAVIRTGKVILKGA